MGGLCVVICDHRGCVSVGSEESAPTGDRGCAGCRRVERTVSCKNTHIVSSPSHAVDAVIIIFLVPVSRSEAPRGLIATLDSIEKTSRLG